MTERELAPCPACGEKATIETKGTYYPDQYHFVRCSSGPKAQAIDCDFRTGNWDTMEQAMNAWNRRAPAPLTGQGDEGTAVAFLREFKACIEAQRKDAPLPAGHDEEGEACGDGVCYQVGFLIDSAISRLSRPPSPSASEAGKPRCTHGHRDGSFCNED